MHQCFSLYTTANSVLNVKSHLKKKHYNFIIVLVWPIVGFIFTRVETEHGSVVVSTVYDGSFLFTVHRMLTHGLLSVCSWIL